MRIVPKDWREFQHYKDRSPPWIRLHKKLLDNYEFHCLPVASRALAPMLWLLASDSIDGLIEASPAKLAFRLRQTEGEVTAALKPLIDNGFFLVEQSDSEALADRKQVAVPETEALQRTEAEAETQPAPRKRSTPATSIAKPDDVEEQTWTDWLALRKAKRAPVTQTVLDGARAESQKAGMSLEAFLKVWCSRGSQGLEAEWLKPAERAAVASETAYQRSMRLRMQEAAPESARKDPSHPALAADFFNAIEVQTRTVERLS
jgi:hypothetical protein